MGRNRAFKLPRQRWWTAIAEVRGPTTSTLRFRSCSGTARGQAHAIVLRRQHGADAVLDGPDAERDGGTVHLQHRRAQRDVQHPCRSPIGGHETQPFTGMHDGDAELRLPPVVDRARALAKSALDQANASPMAERGRLIESPGAA